MREIWFVRHGQSISNANMVTDGSTSPPLTEKGETQAKLVVPAIPNKPDAVLLSSYVRARQTAQPTLDHFNPVSTEEWPIHEFTYLSDAKYVGKRMEDRIPFARAYWTAEDPHSRDDGSCESFAEVVIRLDETKRLMRAHDAPFLVAFSHGLFIRGLIWSITSSHAEATLEGFRSYRTFFRSLSTPNGSISKFVVEDDRIRLTGLDSSHMLM